MLICLKSFENLSIYFSAKYGIISVFRCEWEQSFLELSKNSDYMGFLLLLAFIVRVRGIVLKLRNGKHEYRKKTAKRKYSNASRTHLRTLQLKFA